MIHKGAWIATYEKNNVLVAADPVATDLVFKGQVQAARTPSPGACVAVESESSLRDLFATQFIALWLVFTWAMA